MLVSPAHIDPIILLFRTTEPSTEMLSDFSVYVFLIFQLNFKSLMEEIASYKTPSHTHTKLLND